MKTKFLLSAFLFLSIFSNAQQWQWATGAGGTSWDIANCIYTDASGNSYLTGWYQNTVNFGPNTLTSVGGYDYFLAKYNSSGVCQWAIGTGSLANDVGYGVVADASGNVFVTGTYQNTVQFGSTISLTSLGQGDIFVAKYNSSGICQWASSGGSTLDDQGQAIALDGLGNVVVNGYFKLTATFGILNITSYGSSDAFTGKLNSAGVWQWVADGGGSSGDNGYGISTDANNNIYITGYFRGTAFFSIFPLSSAGLDDIYIVKYDMTGNVVWAKSAGGAMDDHGNGISSDASGNTYLTGWFKNGAASFGTNNVTASGTNEEVFVVKYNSAGTSQWAVSAGSSSYELGTGICLDNLGNPVISGTYQATFTMGTTTLNAYGLGDFFIAKYNTSGTLQWVLPAGGNANDVAYKVSADGLGNIYAGGNFNTTCNFGIYSLTSLAMADIFVAKIDPTATSIPENKNSVAVNVFPNPATEMVNVNSNSIGEIFFYNALGEQISTSHLLTGENNISVSYFPKGIYFYRVVTENNTVTSGYLILE